MAINYNVAKCKNPNGAEGVDYFSCKARKTSDYTFKELAQDINNSTTVTKADAMAVLASMKPFVESALLSGRRVVLDDLGSLVISIRSKCFTKADMQESDFMPSAKIKGYGIIFRPEVDLKKASPRACDTRSWRARRIILRRRRKETHPLGMLLRSAPWGN